jgi:S1-C subfamily serine protease
MWHPKAKNRRGLICLLAIVALSVLVLPAFPQSLADLVDLVRSSVAFVFAQGPDICEKGCSGSAFVVASDGLLITALHVVADAMDVRVRFPGGTAIQADVVAVDVTNDLAILRINQSGLLPLPLAEVGTVRTGQDVIVIGYPHPDLPLLAPSAVTVTRGIVSAVRPPRVQLDAAMNRGNSGGPVLDTRGMVIGVADQGYRGTGLNFAVSADVVTPLLRRALDPTQTRGPLPLPLRITRSVSLVYKSDNTSHSSDFIERYKYIIPV